MSKDYHKIKLGDVYILKVDKSGTIDGPKIITVMVNELGTDLPGGDYIKTKSAVKIYLKEILEYKQIPLTTNLGVLSLEI